MGNVFFLPSTVTLRVKGNDTKSPGTIICGSPGSGKSLADSEKVPTPDGIKQIKDIKIGDSLFDRHGKPTKVLGVYPQGKLDIYEVILSDGRKIRCSEDHLFTVYQSSYDKRSEPFLKSVGELKDDLYWNNEDKNTSKYIIYNNGLLDYNKRPVDIHPYIIGAFIGNGVKGKVSLQLASGDEFVPNKIAKLLSSQLGKEIKAVKEKHNHTYSFKYEDTRNRVAATHLTDNKELIELLTNCYSYNKYIPFDYKYNSKENRLELIRGLLDTDGYIREEGSIYYYTCSKTLKDDIAEVIRSLGNFYATPYEVKMNNLAKHQQYAIYITTFNKDKKEIFSIPKKLDRAVAVENKNNGRKLEWLRIKEINKLDYKEDCTCFLVDNDEHLFIAGDTVVTHNTFFLLNLASNCLAMKQRFISIDGKNDFEKLLNIYPNIKIIDINNIQEGSLNPFTFLKDCNENTLITLIECICGKFSQDDIIAINPIIKDFVTEFKRDGRYVDLKKLSNYLYGNESPSAQKIGSVLRTQAGSKYGKLLFTDDRNVEPLKLDNKGSLIISLFGMQFPDYSKTPDTYSPDEKFTSGIMYLLCKKLYEVLTDKNKIPVTLFIDEAHIIYGSKEMGEIIDQFLVLGRSLGIAVVLASQGITHFPDNIDNYMSTKFIFKSSLLEAEKFLEKFDTSKHDPTLALDISNIMNSIANFKTGDAFMIDSKNRSGVIHIESIFDPELLTRERK